MHRVGACMLNINDIYVMFDMTFNLIVYIHMITAPGPPTPVGLQKMGL